MGPSTIKTTLRAEAQGLALVAAAMAFSAWFAAPELRIERLPINDVVYHLTAAERMATAFERGEPFLDAWVSEWSLGYPLWRSYQPLPHLTAAVAIKTLRGFGDSATVFAALLYLLIVFFPLSVYVGARLLGLPPPAAGLAALLAFGTAGPPGDFERFGLGYGSVVWRGAGLYTQIFALHLFVGALGVTRRALDGGSRRSRIGAAVLLALTAVAHIVLGYVAFVSVAILAVAGPAGQRGRRLVRLVTVALPAVLMLAWFVVPYVLAGPIANHSRWEGVQKWDSYGAPAIIGALLRGQFFDAGRFPALSLLILGGAIGAVLFRGDPLMRRLLGLTGFWLVLFFGRATWGHLVTLAGVPADLPMHRLQSAFELSAVLLGAAGAARMTTWVWPLDKWLALQMIAALGLAVLVIGHERSAYLEVNRAWGEASAAAYAKDQPDLDAALTDVAALIEARPGRVSAGLSGSWGRQFQLGSASVYAFLSRRHFDQVSFLYHSMSKTSDVMVMRREDDPWHDIAFGVRAVVAPAGMAMPPHLRRVSVRGRFAVYESSSEGYFGVVDVAGHYTDAAATAYDASVAWLNSGLPSRGQVISLDPRLAIGPAMARWQPIPAAAAGQATAAGAVVTESKTGETYQSTLAMSRPGYAFLKITWNPDLKATVDGTLAPVYQVTPGFAAIPVPVGRHDVVVAYQPGPTRVALFAAGLGVPFLMWFLLGYGRFSVLETRAEGLLATAIRVSWRPSLPASAALLLLGLVALHPLFRGQLISGHDASAYVPRLVEMERAIGDWHFPTVWAPDLAAGYGQPLFEFAPPLVYWMGLPFRAAGLGTADAVQFGLALLGLAGAMGLYRVARLLGAPRFAAVGGAIAWLFAPYFSLDLFVRAAYAEAAGMAVAPVALWLLLRAVRRPSPRTLAAAAAGAALMQLGHNAVALLLLPACTAVALAYAWAISGGPGARRPTRIAPLAAAVGAPLAALGLAAWFWVPAMVNVSNLHADRFLGGAFNAPDHILYPLQLVWGRWDYGFSIVGANDGMSFALGVTHLGLAVAGAVIGLRSQDRVRRVLAAAFAFAALLGAVLSTVWMVWAWSHVTLLQYFVYPWRVLMVPALFMPLLAVFALERIGVRWSAVALAALVAINLPHTEPKGYLTYDEDYYRPASVAAKGLHTSTQEEYEPRWSDVRPPYDPRGLVGMNGTVEVTTVLRATARQEYRVVASQPVTVEALTYYYPGWTALVDGVETTVSPVPVRGTMRFNVTAGQHDIVLELRRTPVGTMSLLVSLLTLAGLAAASIAHRRRSAP